MIKKIIDFIKLPMRFLPAKRLSRLQHLKIKLFLLVAIILGAFVCVGLLMLLPMILPNMAVKIVYFLIWGFLVTLYVVFSLYAGIGRLHDCNLSGWWILLVNIGFEVILPVLFLYCWRGSKGKNKYGEPSDRIWVLASERG